MTAPPIFPTVAQVLEFHRLALDRDGGAPGVLDVAGIEAALARPHQLAAYSSAAPTLFAMVGAAAYSIIRIRHPFVDGNKRVAAWVCATTLYVNDQVLDATEHEAEAIFRGIAEGTIGEEQFVAWLESSCRPR